MIYIDPQEIEEVGYCTLCDGEIYPDDDCYIIEGERIHEDCLTDYAKKYFKSVKA